MARKSVAERLADNSVPEPNTGCVLWLGAVNTKGYGLMSVDDVMRMVHRLAYEVDNGPIPPRTLVCHKCDQPSCIRADHLFSGTHKDNAQDKVAKGRGRGQRNTQCPSGHPYDKENTITRTRTSGRTYRLCRICHVHSINGLRHDRAARTPEDRAADNAAARIRTSAYRKRKKAERESAAVAA